MPSQKAARGQDPPPPPYRPRPTLTLSIAHPYGPSGHGEEEEGEDGREATGVRLCELLQAGGVSVRPLGKHLAISLPSLPLRLWDTHVTHTSLSAHLKNTQSPPPPSPPLETLGQRKPLAPLWQPPQPPTPDDRAHHRQQCDATADSGTRHWSSWSLDRPDAVVSPYDTPPDRCVPIRPQTPCQNYSYSCQSSPGHYSAQHALGRQGNPCCDREEAELSELDSLYQASLQAGRTGKHTHTYNKSGFYIPLGTLH